MLVYDTTGPRVIEPDGIIATQQRIIAEQASRIAALTRFLRITQDELCAVRSTNIDLREQLLGFLRKLCK